MLIPYYTHAHANILNKLFIPEIAEPFPIKIHWFRALSFDEKNSVISQEMHLHTFFEVHLVVSGRMEYSSNDGKHFVLDAGKGILISPCTEHMVNSYSSNFVKFSLAFVLDETSSLYHKLAENGIYAFDLSDVMLNSIDSVLREVDLSTSFSLTLVKNRMLDIICAISRAVGIYEYCTPTDLTVEDKRVTAAKLYIKDNNSRFLTCNEVASQCGLSPKQMNRIFYTATGKNLHEYINIIKIKEAERLLADTSLPIKEISESLGFSSVYYFNRFFSKNAGFPPAHFRRISAK